MFPHVIKHVHKLDNWNGGSMDNWNSYQHCWTRNITTTVNTAVHRLEFLLVRITLRKVGFEGEKTWPKSATTVLPYARFRKVVFEQTGDHGRCPQQNSCLLHQIMATNRLRWTQNIADIKRPYLEHVRRLGSFEAWNYFKFQQHIFVPRQFGEIYRNLYEMQTWIRGTLTDRVCGA